MDYEFKKNSLDGQYYCQCSMGHEIVGRWLQEEIGAERTQIIQILEFIDLAKQHYDQEHCYSGREISVTICDDEVIVRDNAMLFTEETASYEEEFTLYESESSGCCGIEDFERLIRQWADFTNH